jgi:hypothetical protein
VSLEPAASRGTARPAHDLGSGDLGLDQAAQAPWADALGARVGEKELEPANRALDRALAAFAEAARDGD